MFLREEINRYWIPKIPLLPSSCGFKDEEFSCFKQVENALFIAKICSSEISNSWLALSVESYLRDKLPEA